MARRASNAPSTKLHDMTATWSNGTGGTDAAPGERLGGMTYVEMCQRHDVRDWTDTSVKLDRLDRAVYREPQFGGTCRTCYVQRAVNGTCMC